MSDTKQALNAATLDLFTNGDLGRTLEDIAHSYDVSIHSLKSRVKVERAKGREIPGTMLDSEGRRKRNPDALRELDGGKKVTSQNAMVGEGDLTRVESTSKAPLGPVEAALEAHNRQIRDLVGRSIRAGAPLMPCKTASDLKTLDALMRLACGEVTGKGKAGSGSMVNIQILGDLTSKAPKMVQKRGSIMESANESGVTIDVRPSETGDSEPG